MGKKKEEPVKHECRNRMRERMGLRSKRGTLLERKEIERDRVREGGEWVKGSRRI